MEQDKNSAKNIFNFNHMLTPHIITFVYCLSVIALGAIGIAAMIQGEVIQGVLIIVFGFLGVRIWCELMIVLFKINENIQRIADKT